MASPRGRLPRQEEKEIAEKKIFRTVAGFVAFDPREREANGKTLRNFQVRQTGIHPAEAVDVSCTLWPELDHAPVEKGDFVAVEGSYTTKQSEGNTYHNLSAVRISVNGKLFEADKPGVENAVQPDDDEIPF